MIYFINPSFYTDLKLEKKIKNKEDLQALCKVKCAAGLADLNSKRYKSAAKYFLAASLDNFTHAEVITPNNVAIYGCLCALATFDRNELRTYLIQSR